MDIKDSICPTLCNPMHFSSLHLILNKFLFKSQFYCYRYTYHTTHSSEGYNSMSFQYIYLRLGNHHQNQTLEHFCPFIERILSIFIDSQLQLPSFAIPTRPSFLQKTTDLLSVSVNFPIQDISYQCDHIIYLYISLLTYTYISLTYKDIFLTYTQIYTYIYIYMYMHMYLYTICKYVYIYTYI